MQVNIGKGIELEVNPARFNAEVMDHVIYIGLRNILMDSHAGVTKDDPEYVAKSRAVAEKKLEALLAGELRTVSTRETDPVKAEAVKLAVTAIRAKLKAVGKKADEKVIREKAREIHEKFLVQARKNVEAAKAIEIDIDL